MKRKELKAEVARLRADLDNAFAECAGLTTEAAELRKQVKRSEADADRWCAAAANAVAELSNATAEWDKALKKLAQAKAAAELDTNTIEDQARRLEDMGAALTYTQESLDDLDNVAAALRITIDAQAGALAEAVALAASAIPHMPRGGSRTRYRQRVARLEALLRPPT